MAENSKIEWTHHTFNPWRGCTKISPGCAHCYAETMSHRNPAALGEWGPDGKRVIAAEAYWRLPLKWDREAKAAGERRRVFCASLADVFEERKEVIEPRMRLFQLIGQTPNLDWLLLTKRPQTALANWPLWAGYWASQTDKATVKRLRQDYVIPNIWLGVSVEDQARADERIPLLLQTPAAVRFLSCEPLLGNIILGQSLYWHQVGAPGIGWVIVGGESGHGARPMHPTWARSIRDQCQAAGVPFLFKQWGEWSPVYDWDAREHTQLHADGRRKGGLLPDSGPGWCVMNRVGKRAAGRLLDGREWNEFPQVIARR